MDVSELFSKNLSRLRKSKGLSLRALAKVTGISFRMIHHYENNPTSIPMEKLKILADALDVNISSFFDEKCSDDQLTAIDVRWIKKIQQLKELSESDRREINKHINSLLAKSKMEKQLQDNSN